MGTRIDRHGLQIDQTLFDFIEGQALPGTGVDADAFWEALSTLAHEFGPKNAELLKTRDDIQTKIDEWHIRHRNQLSRSRRIHSIRRRTSPAAAAAHQRDLDRIGDWCKR